MDKCREEFTDWYTSQSGLNVIFDEYNVPYDGTKGVISNTVIQAAWLAWKASRESMKAIKLPESKEIYHMAQHGMTKMIDLNDTISAITSAGYKVE